MLTNTEYDDLLRDLATSGFIDSISFNESEQLILIVQKYVMRCALCECRTNELQTRRVSLISEGNFPSCEESFEELSLCDKCINILGGFKC